MAVIPAARPSSLIALVVLAACAPGAETREARVVEALTRADEPMLRTRPLLVAGKYNRMSEDAVGFMRGSLAIAVRDWGDARPIARPSRFAIASPRVPSLGDAHPENFGVLWSASAGLVLDHSASFEPNDFDAADDLPYLVDVRRLAATMAYAVEESNGDDEDKRRMALAARSRIVAALLTGYRETIHEFAANRVPEPIDLATPIIADLIGRSTRDAGSRATLAELTVLDGTERLLKRGAPDPTEPTQAMVDVPAALRGGIADLVRNYQARLPVVLPPGFLHVKDVARTFGSGVSSWPRIRLLLLVEGATSSTEDDIVLEAKELGDAPWPPAFPPLSAAATNRDRVNRSAHRAFSSTAVEPLWQTTDWMGIEWQLRRETESQKSVRVARWVGTLGTPEALMAFAKELGHRLACVHGRPLLDRQTNAMRVIDATIAEAPDAFVSEEVSNAIESANGLRDDLRHLRSARARLGPLLGFFPGEASSVPIDFAALVGVPPTP